MTASSERALRTQVTTTDTPEASSRAHALKEALERVRAHPSICVKVALTDIDGVHRGKYVSRDKMLAALESGFGFCDVVLGWDTQDQLYDNVAFTGWHTGYPDAQVRVLPETCRPLSLEDDTLLFLAEFSGEAEAICPRGVLRRVLESLAELGYGLRAGLEYEFFVFDETPRTAAEKRYRDLKPFTPGNFGYSVLRSSVHSAIYRELMQMGEAMRFPLEGLHTETGPGVLEAALAPSDGIESADRANLFKTFSKVLFQRSGRLSTFMAKCANENPGQSGHVHVSLTDASGANAFFDETQTDGISEVMRWFVGGQQRFLPEFLALVAPTVNAYTRLIPGYWAPTAATWGVENRTCALRVVPAQEKGQRVEFRVAAADANPYLAVAAALGAGLLGIREKIEPRAPVRGNAYELEVEPELRFPSTLGSAADRLMASSAARELFGEPFVEHFGATRHWEERAFRGHVTDWELERYFEII